MNTSINCMFFPKTRNGFCIVWIVLALSVFCSGGGPTVAQETGETAPAKKPPNIVFLFTDDHACAATGCYGAGLVTTPSLDRLASEGMRFNRCLVTNALCGPSRATILTGKYSHLNGFRQNGDRFDGSQFTFAKALQKAGYDTAVVGKWHLVSEPTGFDYWNVLPGQGDYYNPDFITPAGKERVEGYVTDIITDKALGWLDGRQDKDRPFVLMVQHKAPHREWLPGPDHLNMYDDVMFPEPATLLDNFAGRESVLAENEMEIGSHMRDAMDLRIFSEGDMPQPFQNSMNRLNPEQRQNLIGAYREENQKWLGNPAEGDERTRYYYQRYMRDYLRCIASVDDNVGRVLKYLDDNGLTENTVVVYSSDQGFFLGEHGLYDKRWLFEPCLRTPLLVRWPGNIQAGSTCDRIVSNLDFAETFMELAGLPVPADMQGASLVPLLRGEEPASWRKDFYYHYYELGTHNVAAHDGVITDRYKLAHYYARMDENKKPQQIDQWELMDLQVNPNETRSFLNDPDYAAIAQELKSRLVEMRRELKVDSQ